MKYVGSTTDMLFYPSKCYQNNAKAWQKRRIYEDEVNMATEDDLQVIDDRIFLRELEIIQKYNFYENKNT